MVDPKMYQKNDRFWDRFFDHLGSILGTKLGQCWPRFRPNGAALWKSAPFLLRWNFRFDILRRGPMGYSIFGAVGRWGTPFLAPGGDGVPRFWLHFCAKLALFWAIWGGFVGLRKA